MKKPLPDEEEAICMSHTHLSSIRLLELAPCYIVTVAAGSLDQVPPPTLDKKNHIQLVGIDNIIHDSPKICQQKFRIFVKLGE